MSSRMGNLLSYDHEFTWDYTDEPHTKRRLKILKKHPEVKHLMHAKGDRSQAVIGISLCLLQLCFGILNCYIPMPLKFALNIVVGSWIATYLFLLIHEASHNLVFGPSYPMANKLFGLFVNLFCGVPIFSFYKKHHKDHHKFQGETHFDVEYPTDIEMRLMNRNCVTRFFWLCMNPIFQNIRSKFDCPKKPYTWEERINQWTVLGLDAALIYFGYPWIATHFAMAFFVATGTNLVGLWGLVAHTLFFGKEDTVSYYGWMNPWYMNFGHHLEHHDFPNVPARYLSEIRKAAPEFYDDTRHSLDSLYAPAINFFYSGHYGIHSRLMKDRHIAERLEKRG